MTLDICRASEIDFDYDALMCAYEEASETHRQMSLDAYNVSKAGV